MVIAIYFIILLTAAASVTTIYPTSISNYLQVSEKIENVFYNRPRRKVDLDNVGRGSEGGSVSGSGGFPLRGRL